MIDHTPLIAMTLSILGDFWINLKIYKKNEFIEWSKSVEDIDNIISGRVFIAKMELDTLGEFLILTRIIMAISTLIFFMQAI